MTMAYVEEIKSQLLSGSPNWKLDPKHSLIFDCWVGLNVGVQQDWVHIYKTRSFSGEQRWAKISMVDPIYWHVSVIHLYFRFEGLNYAARELSVCESPPSAVTHYKAFHSPASAQRSKSSYMFDWTQVTIEKCVAIGLYLIKDTERQWQRRWRHRASRGTDSGQLLLAAKLSVYLKGCLEKWAEGRQEMSGLVAIRAELRNAWGLGLSPTCPRGETWKVAQWQMGFVRKEIWGGVKKLVQKWWAVVQNTSKCTLGKTRITT